MPRNYRLGRFVVLECFNRLVWNLYIETCTIMFLDFIAMCSHLYSVFFNKSGRGWPGLSRGECHSEWPFCTRLGLATSLVGRLPSRLLRYPRCGGLAGCLTWIGRLPHYGCRWIRFRIRTHVQWAPPKWPYIRRHIGLSQAVRVWQLVSPDSRVIHNPRPSWDFRLGLCLARSPLHRWIRLVLVVHLLVV